MEKEILQVGNYIASSNKVLGKELSFIEAIKNINEFVTLLKENEQRNNTHISPTAIIGKNVYIGNNCKIYDYACIRDNTIILDNVIIGHCSEIANSIIFSNTNITHKVSMSFCIIGEYVNVGACCSLAPISIFNADFMNPTITIKIHANGETLDSNLFKLGCLIGDYSKIGMNSSTAPGVIIGKNVIVYPNIFLRTNLYQENSIIKADDNIKIIRHDV